MSLNKRGAFLINDREAPMTVKAVNRFTASPFLGWLSSTNCFVIAEAGVNHNGQLALALKLVEAAAKAGADAVKYVVCG
jgi:hypothetical protein